ncbi:MAG: AI-2E family transporter [Clostridia bacterium]|nr:AI-2E family transporter [Clostridia bacterium]
MKQEHHNKRYMTIAVYSALVLMACIFFVFLILNLDRVWSLLRWLVSVLSPILIGAMLAYAFSPLVTLFETKVFCKRSGKPNYRLSRALAVLATYLIVISLMVLLVMNLIPSVLRGYADLADMSELYLETLKGWLRGFSLGDTHALGGYFDKVIEYIVGLLDSVYGIFDIFTPDITAVVGTLVSILGDVVLGVILSIYFLFAKDLVLAQFKKAARALLGRRKFGAFCRSVRMTNDKFGGFLKGQLVDALIVGSLTYVCLLIIGVPYYPLVSVIVGLSAFIPLFGMIIGAIIGAGIILLADPLDALWFALYMIGLHMVNKHMIKPKVVRTGADASSVFMLTALIVTTGLVGFWGLIIGVPVFAVLYAFLHSGINRRLSRRGLPTDSGAYYETEAGKELYEERQHKRERHRRLGGYTDTSETLFEPTEEDGDDPSIETEMEAETGIPELPVSGTSDDLT